MSRGPLTFKEADLVRAVRAAIKAGLAVERTRIKPNGEIVLEHHVREDEKVEKDALHKEIVL